MTYNNFLGDKHRFYFIIQNGKCLTQCKAYTIVPRLWIISIFYSTFYVILLHNLHILLNSLSSKSKAGCHSESL